MTNELVSIIIPIYNSEKTLKKCLDSVINQTYRNIEIILINDGSTDDSLYIISKYEKKDKRIKIITSKNEGAALSRNKGLDIAKGNYICFIDSDDYVSLNYVKVLLEAIKNNNADVVECNYIRVEDNKEIKKDIGSFNSSSNKEINKGFVNNIYFKNYLVNKIYSKEIIGKNRLKSFYTSEDYEFLSRIYFKANKKINIKDYLYYYVNNTNSVSNTRINIKTLDVINARNEVYKMYFNNNDFDLCYLISSKIVFYVFKFYIEANELSNEEKKLLHKEIKKMYKLHYKNAIKVKYRTNGQKITFKRKTIKFIAYNLFFIIPNTISKIMIKKGNK